MAKYNRPTVKTGEQISQSGYYIYDGSPDRSQIPCYPAKHEKIVELTAGSIAPPVKSCNDHPAMWKLIIKKNPLRSPHIHAL